MPQFLGRGVIWEKGSKMRGKSRIRRAVEILLPLSLVALALTWSLTRVGRLGEGEQGPPVRPGVVPAPPTCPTDVAPSLVVPVATASSALEITADCFYAPSDTPFAIVFSNNTMDADLNGFRLQLSLYPSQAAAITEVGNEITTHGGNALFTGLPILAPRSLTYAITSLPAGTYYIQSDYYPAELNATFVVNDLPPVPCQPCNEPPP